MTTTPQVDLAEARDYAAILDTLDLEAGGAILRALADEVEALRKEIEGWKADQRENIQVAIALQAELADCQAQRSAAFRTIEQLQDELALKAVGPDGLPPLPERKGRIMFDGGECEADWLSTQDAFDEEQMQAYARAAIAAQQPSISQALTDPENQPNQFGVEFGMAGKKMFFQIGNQRFTLDHEPEDGEGFKFMCDMLAHALSVFTPDVNPVLALAQKGGG